MRRVIARSHATLRMGIEQDTQKVLDASASNLSSTTVNSICAHLSQTYGPLDEDQRCKVRETVQDYINTAVAKSKQTVMTPPSPSGGLHKPKVLSETLAGLLGETHLPRTQVVKKLWEYIKANGLQDPEDKRYIMPDAAFGKVFGPNRLGMMAMNSQLSAHLSD